MSGAEAPGSPASRGRIRGGALVWLIGGEWRAHPARLVAAVLAIAVGVALGFAVHLVNRAALDSFARAVNAVSGAADVQVHSVTPAGVNEGLYPKLARVHGVVAASPVVELTGWMRRADAGAGGRGDDVRVTLLGLDMMRAMQVTPSLIGRVGAQDGAGAEAWLDEDVVFLSRAALAATGTRIGSMMLVTAAGRRHVLRVAGTLPVAGEARALAVMDIAAAQWRFGQLGRLQRIDLALEDGVPREMAMAAVVAALPPDAELVTAQDEVSRSDSLSRAYRVNLGMLAMVALLTGGFLVFSAQSLSVARRVPQFALLRVLGQRRGALRRQLLVEGLVLGLAGSLIGLVIGYGLALLVLRLMGADLGGGYFEGRAVALAPAPEAALGFAALGIAVAVVASLVPADAAARAQPAVALKAGGEAGDAGRQGLGGRWGPGLWVGLAMLALAGLAAAAPPVRGLPVFGYVAMALLLAGGIAVMPWLARALLAPLVGRDWPVPVGLALRRLWGAPSAAAVALSGIVASTSLMVAMAVMVASFRGSVDEWLVQLLPADIYLHVEGGEAGGLGSGLDRATQARLRAVPGVAGVRFVRQMPLRLAPGAPPVVLSGQPVAVDPAASLPMMGTSVPAALWPKGLRPVWVSEPLALLQGLAPGDRLRLPLGGGQEVFVAGVWRDYARQFGAVAMDTADFEALTGDTGKTEAGLVLAPGADVAVVMRAVKAALPPAIAARTVIAEPRAMRAEAMRIFDRSFAITYALEVIAILIGLIGVATAFSAQTLARVREFGMLRHVGVRRGQVMAMLMSEGAGLGALGVVAGIGLGLVMAQVLIQVVNPQSFHWTMETRLPWGLFAGLMVAIVLAAAGTALLAGRRALSVGAVQAVRADW